MLIHKSQFIGYKLNSAIGKLDKNKELIVQITQTPLKNKMEERMGNEPIVIKHTEDNNRVILTVSYFK